MADRRKRSAQEREAARLERERRRAERRDEEAAGGSEADPGEDAEPRSEAPTGSDTATGPAEPSSDGHRNETPVLHKIEAPMDEGEDDPDLPPDEDEVEVALGTRRTSHRDRLRARARARGSAASTVRRPAAPRRRDRLPASVRRSWIGRVGAVVGLAAGLALIWFLVELFQPFHGPGHASVTVRIAPHTGASQIADQLEREGVISSSFFFNVRAILAGDRGSLLAGTYHLREDMSYGDVLRILTTPPPAAKVTNVTLIEGLTRRQIDALLSTQGVHGSYLAATDRSSLLDPHRYGAPRSTPSLEGFLFPDTYQLTEPIRISALVADQLEQFKREFATVNLGYARSQKLTPYDVLIIASIIEKEAQTARDRPLVSAVIYNRLRDHIPLGMDATTRYQFNDYDKPLTRSQLASPSPYNTRLHPGLPPTPISNPGLAAIEAAAHPAHTNFLYFVVKPCGNGEQVFTASYPQFLSDVAKYQAARARNHGRSPAHC